MTNREHYSEQIIDICAKGGRPIIYTDGLTGCYSHDCSGCHNWGINSMAFSGHAFSVKHRSISRNGWKKNMSRRLTGRKCQ